MVLITTMEKNYNTVITMIPIIAIHAHAHAHRL